MSKKICKEGDKESPKNGKELKYYCKACGAEANKEKHLCKPKKH